MIRIDSRWKATVAPLQPSKRASLPRKSFGFPAGVRRTIQSPRRRPRADSDFAQLARLKPAFGPDTTITAGNSSMISDGAAAVVVASESAAARAGRKPLARIVASATSGGEPQDLFTAPVDAVRRVVAQSGPFAR